MAKNRVESETKLHDEWTRLREFQLQVEKEKQFVEQIRKERDDLVEEGAKKATELFRKSGEIAQLEERLRDLKHLHESSQKQLELAAAQAQTGQHEANKLRSLHEMAERERQMIENLTSENRSKEDARARHQDETVRLLNAQLVDLRRDVDTKNSEIQILTAAKAKIDQESDEKRERVMKLQEENIKLRSEVGGCVVRIFMVMFTTSGSRDRED